MRNWDNEIDGEDADKVSEVLVGRRIVAADEGEATLTLDNGDVLRVLPNEGCGGCSSGWFALSSLADCDNVITRVECQDGETAPDEWGCADEVLSIFVFAEGMSPKMVIEVTGSEGNGYYGRGFDIEVVRAGGK